MKKLSLAFLPAVLAGVLYWGAGGAVLAETGAAAPDADAAGDPERSIEELQKLLQDSLTIAEIDREMERLSREETRLAAELEGTEADIRRQAELERRMRDRAGKVLRAYYMRDRQNLWLLLVHADSFSDALNVLSYLKIVAEHDRRSMERYAEARAKLAALQDELQNRLQELADAKADYLRQRARRLALQAELDRKLAEAADREALIARMEALNRRWREEGLPYFQSFLEAMSGALAELPDYVGAHPDSLTQERRRVTFTVRERELNDFLRERNALFGEFDITMTADGLAITGSRGDLAIGVEGRFELVETPEPAIRFDLRALRFGPFELPDTTVADLARRFPMTFSTRQHELTAFLVPAGVEHREGELAIIMNIDF